MKKNKRREEGQGGGTGGSRHCISEQSGWRGVAEGVPCGKDVKTVRGESGRYLGENIPGRRNNKEVMLLGPWGEGCGGRVGP